MREAQPSNRGTCWIKRTNGSLWCLSMRIRILDMCRKQRPQQLSYAWMTLLTGAWHFCLRSAQNWLGGTYINMLLIGVYKILFHVHFLCKKSNQTYTYCIGWQILIWIMSQVRVLIFRLLTTTLPPLFYILALNSEFHKRIKWFISPPKNNIIYPISTWIHRLCSKYSLKFGNWQYPDGT